jgi:lysophospholipase L1-like esterase
MGSTWHVRTLAALAVAANALAILRAAGPAAARPCHGPHWVGVWATSPADALAGPFVDQSLRLVVTPTLGGAVVRVRLSNRYGTQAVTLAAVAVARRASGADLLPGTTQALRFQGRRSVTIPAGGEVLSDARRFTFDAFADLAVSLHVAGSSGRATEHPTAIQVSYASPAGSGDHTGDDAGTAFTSTIITWPLLTDVEVRTAGRVRAVVALGDSITDGLMTPLGQNRRYPDVLAHRLAAAGLRLAVQNEGISGNRVIRPGVMPSFGPSLLDRLTHDALDQAGARVVIFMEGTNDIGIPPLPSAAEVEAGLQQAIDRMHQKGLRVILGTIPPCRNFALALHGTPEAIALRNQINDWIRTNGTEDGLVDFHAVLRDPNDPDQLNPAFDSGDHLHPNAAGYAAMAGAVDLGSLDVPGCRER